jgi:hypothetical protein
LSSGKVRFWDAVEEFRKSPDFEPIDDDFLEGLRDPSPGREIDL